MQERSGLLECMGYEATSSSFGIPAGFQGWVAGPLLGFSDFEHPIFSNVHSIDLLISHLPSFQVLLWPPSLYPRGLCSAGLQHSDHRFIKVSQCSTTALHARY